MQGVTTRRKEDHVGGTAVRIRVERGMIFRYLLVCIVLDSNGVDGV